MRDRAEYLLLREDAASRTRSEKRVNCRVISSPGRNATLSGSRPPDADQRRDASSLVTSEIIPTEKQSQPYGTRRGRATSMRGRLTSGDFRTAAGPSYSRFVRFRCRYTGSPSGFRVVCAALVQGKGKYSGRRERDSDKKLLKTTGP